MRRAPPIPTYAPLVRPLGVLVDRQRHDDLDEEEDERAEPEAHGGWAPVGERDERDQTLSCVSSWSNRARALREARVLCACVRCARLWALAVSRERASTCDGQHARAHVDVEGPIKWRRCVVVAVAASSEIRSASRITFFSRKRKGLLAGGCCVAAGGKPSWGLLRARYVCVVCVCVCRGLARARAGRRRREPTEERASAAACRCCKKRDRVMCVCV